MMLNPSDFTPFEASHARSVTLSTEGDCLEVRGEVQCILCGDVTEAPGYGYTNAPGPFCYDCAQGATSGVV